MPKTTFLSKTLQKPTGKIGYQANENMHVAIHEILHKLKQQVATYQCASQKKNQRKPNSNVSISVNAQTKTDAKNVNSFRVKKKILKCDFVQSKQIDKN